MADNTTASPGFEYDSGETVSGTGSASTLEMSSQEKAKQGWKKKRPFGFQLSK